MVSKLAISVRNVDTYLVEITERGRITSMTRWSNGREVRRERLDHRLLRPVLPGESDEEFEYVGDIDPSMRLCNVVFRRSGVQDEDLSRALIFVILEQPIEDLPLALYRGLKNDLMHCFDDVAGVGILFDPGDRLDGFP